MKLLKNLMAVSLFSGVLILPMAWGSALKVVTTTPDLASIVRAVGGDTVQVQSLASPLQNPHFVDAKPSMIVKLMKADLFVQTGMDLEIGWAPLLQQSSGNKEIQNGARGFLDASTAITPLEVPLNPTRAMGDVHPAGNPHYLLDPENGKLVARLIAKKLEELSPQESATFKKNLVTFEKNINEKLERWLRDMEPYRGTKFVSYHKVYPYFGERFGIISIGEIEPKPGIPPTASHTNRLMEQMKAEKVKIILIEPWYEKRSSEAMAKQTGAQVITMALFPGTVPEAKNYLEAVNYNLMLLLKVLSTVR